MTDHVRTEQSDGVLTLTLNRPEKKNALTRAVPGARRRHRRRRDRSEHALFVVRGRGDAFTAGNDLGDFAAINRSTPRRPASSGTNPLLKSLARTTTPIVAAVRGRAVGIGTTMLLHCDPCSWPTMRCCRRRS